MKMCKNIKTPPPPILVLQTLGQASIPVLQRKHLALKNLDNFYYIGYYFNLFGLDFLTKVMSSEMDPGEIRLIR